MKITMSQLNYTIGDFENNSKKILDVCEDNKNSDLIIFTELCLSGYYPWDLIYRDDFFKRQDKSLNEIISFSKKTKSHIVIGYVRKSEEKYGKNFYNSLAVIHNGNIVFNYDKKLLPTYNIFDEKRHFEEGTKSGLFEMKIDNNMTKKIGFFICEDGWNDESHEYIANPIKEVVNGGASIIIGINSSPSNIYKQELRSKIFGLISKKYGVPLLYVNQVGANDEIVFDGASFYFNNKGEKEIQLKSFAEETLTFDIDKKHNYLNEIHSDEEFMMKQIVIGLQDYLQKQNIKKVVVGSSGGIDSAITIAIAVIALGSDNVDAITMPSEFSSIGSVTDSKKLCENLGITLKNQNIKESFDLIIRSFTDSFENEPSRLTKENLQARIRGQILMAYSNHYGNLVLTTGNKSEISVGYFTLYGDSNGGLNLIGDLYKTDVYKLAKYINLTYSKNFNVTEIIPSDIITKAPSAELSPNQKDTDSLPDYEILDTILKYNLELDLLPPDVAINIKENYTLISKQEIDRVLKLIDGAEFKRKQSAPIIRVRSRSFGNGRKVPIVHKVKY